MAPWDTYWEEDRGRPWRWRADKERHAGGGDSARRTVGLWEEQHRWGERGEIPIAVGYSSGWSGKGKEKESKPS